MDKQIQFLIYNTPTEQVKVEVVIKDETLWLTQKAICLLYTSPSPRDGLLSRMPSSA